MSQQLGFFDFEEAAPAIKEVPKEKKAVDPLACPRCGGPSQVSVRPLEMGGTRYCPVCQGEEGCFYFTPKTGQEIVKEAFDEVEQVIAETPEIQEKESVLEQVDAAVEIIQTRAEAEKNGQIPLINIGEWWEEHWKGMPEFKSEDLSPFKTLLVHFESREDMEKFAKLVGQQINFTTKSVWYPEAAWDEVAKIRWLSKPEKLREDKLNNKKQELIEILDGE